MERKGSTGVSGRGGNAAIMGERRRRRNGVKCITERRSREWEEVKDGLGVGPKGKVVKIRG